MKKIEILYSFFGIALATLIVVFIWDAILGDTTPQIQAIPIHEKDTSVIASQCEQELQPRSPSSHEQAIHDIYSRYNKEVIDPTNEFLSNIEDKSKAIDEYNDLVQNQLDPDYSNIYDNYILQLPDCERGIVEAALYLKILGLYAKVHDIAGEDSSIYETGGFDLYEYYRNIDLYNVAYDLYDGVIDVYDSMSDIYKDILNVHDSLYDGVDDLLNSVQ